MSKQKSYVVTDAADQMAAELAEVNGLTKSSVVEILIRQAYAKKWSVAAIEAADDRELAYAEQKPLFIDFNQLKSTKPTRMRLANALASAVGVTHWGIEGEKTCAKLTWQQMARLGRAHFMQLRNVGAGTIKEIEDILLEKGCPMLP